MKNNKTLLTYIVYGIIAFSLFVPEYLQTFPILSYYYQYSKVIICFCIAIYLLITKKRISPYNVILIGYFSYLIAITLLFNQDIVRMISISFSVVSMSLFAELGFRNHKKIFINTVWTILFVYCLINLLTLVLYPSGMYTTVLWEEANGDFYSNLCWFLGFKNHHLRFIIPLLFFSILRSYIQDKKRLFSPQLFASLVIAVISSLLGKSATVILGTSIIVVFYFLLHFLKERLNIWFVLTFNIAVFVFLMMVSFGDETMLSIAEGLFGKASTLGSRFGVWQKALGGLENNLVFGFGRQYNQDKIMALGFNNTHNSFLETLYTGGLIGFTLFVFLLFLTMKPMKRISKCHYLYNAIAYTLFSVLIVSQLETAFFENTIVLLIGCAYFVPNVFSNQSNEMILHCSTKSRVFVTDYQS